MKNLLATLAEELGAEGLAALLQLLRRDFVALGDAHDHRALCRRDRIADAVHGQAEGHSVHLRARANIGQGRSARDERGLLGRHALRLCCGVEILRRAKSRGNLTRTLPAQVGGPGANQIVADAVLHFLELRHVRVLLLGSPARNTGPRGVATGPPISLSASRNAVAAASGETPRPGIGDSRVKSSDSWILRPDSTAALSRSSGILIRSASWPRAIGDLLTGLLRREPFLYLGPDLFQRACDFGLPVGQP